MLDGRTLGETGVIAGERRRQPRSRVLAIVVAWLAIIPLAALWYTQHEERTGAVGIHVVPEAPRPGEPMLISFPLRNRTNYDASVAYELHANGVLLGSGAVVLPPRSVKLTQYAYRSDTRRGEQITFMARATGENGATTKARTLPAYPSQVWSSFSSFAAFSSTSMSSLTDMAYFRRVFDANSGPNLGVAMAFTLIGLLIFLEVSRPLLIRRVPFVEAVWPRYQLVSTVLLLVLAGVVYTRVMFVVEASG